MNGLQNINVKENNYSLYNNKTNIRYFNTSFKQGTDSVQIAKNTVNKNKGKILTFLTALFGSSLFINKSKKNKEQLPDDKIIQLKSIVRNLKKRNCYNEKDIQMIKDNLNKYSIDDDSASFVNECLDFIVKNKENKLYSCHEFGTGWIMNNEGCNMIFALEWALGKALDSKSPFNVDPEQAEGLKEYMTSAREFMANYEK